MTFTVPVIPYHINRIARAFTQYLTKAKRGFFVRNLKWGDYCFVSFFLYVTHWSLTTIRPYLGMGYAISGLATMPLTCSLTYMTLRGRLRPETLPKFVEKRLRTTRKLFQIFHTRIWLVYYLEINFTRWYTRYESFQMTFFEIETKFNAKQDKFNFKIIDRPNGHAKCTKSARCFCWPYTCFPIKLYFPTISYSCSFHILFHWERLHRSICRKISFYESYSCWKLEYKS